MGCCHYHYIEANDRDDITTYQLLTNPTTKKPEEDLQVFYEVPRAGLEPARLLLATGF